MIDFYKNKKKNYDLIPIRVMEFIMIIATIGVLSLIAFSITMRYIVKSDLYASEEIATLFAMWLYFISAAYASYEKTHIKADIVLAFAKNKTKIKIIKIINGGISIIILCFFVYWSIEFAAWSIGAGGKTAGWKIPLIYSQIPITIGFCLMLIYTTYHFIGIFRKEGRH